MEPTWAQIMPTIGVSKMSKKKGFFVFLRSGSLQEGANLTNLHPSCATLSPHMAKVDKFEVVLIVFG